jgi:hypothetical protein
VCYAITPVTAQVKRTVGHPTRIPGKKRAGLIRARVLPETEAIFTLAAGGSDKVPTLLDELAQIIARLKEL